MSCTKNIAVCTTLLVLTLLLTQCAKPQTIYNQSGKPVATALSTPTGYVTRHSWETPPL